MLKSDYYFAKQSHLVKKVKLFNIILVWTTRANLFHYGGLLHHYGAIAPVVNMLDDTLLIRVCHQTKFKFGK